MCWNGDLRDLSGCRILPAEILSSYSGKMKRTITGAVDRMHVLEIALTILHNS